MKYRAASDSGVALMVVLLAMMIFTVMMLGFYFVTTGEQKVAVSDRDNSIAFYGAVGALEKMSSDLAGLFLTKVPSSDEVTGLTTKTYRDAAASYLSTPSGGQLVDFSGGYSICQPPVPPATTAPCPMPAGTPLNSPPGIIGGSGPLQGLQGLIMPFTLTVVASGPNGTEVKMMRQVQAVAVPVFQFGIFSSTDLSYFAGPNFSFSGRVATNGNLFLAEGPGHNLTLNDKVTAYGDVVRTQLSNGYGTGTGSGYEGEVDLLNTAGGCTGAPPPPAGTCLALTESEGSVVGGPGSADTTTPTPWTTISLTTYKGYIRNRKTGVKSLNLDMALAGAAPISMIQRPVTVPPAAAMEDPTSIIGHDRYINQASMRILLSDTTDALTKLPGATATTLPLDSSLNITGGPSFTWTPDACHPPVALSPGTAVDKDYMSAVNTTLLGGNIKIEIETGTPTSPTWVDVTKEILSLGISRDVQSAGAGSCAKNLSILHLEEVKPGVTLSSTGIYPPTPPGPTPPGSATAVTNPYNFVPINMYDTREGEVRDISLGKAGASLNGVMNIIEIDVGNLQKWLANTLCNSTTVPTSCPSGPSAYNLNPGYIVYFSDRRNNFCPVGTTGCVPDAGDETGEYGNEDIINPADVNGTPNTTPDAPEDVNGDGILRTYGAAPHPDFIATAAPCGTTGPPKTDCKAATVGVSGASFTGASWAALLATMPTNNPAFVRIPTGPGTGSCPANSSCVPQKNPVVLARHALRLVNGTLGNLPPLEVANCSVAAGSSATAGGFTVAAENPVYIQGNYNATGGLTPWWNDTATQCHVPAAVIGDTVTMLSNAWRDSDSFNCPITYAPAPGTGCRLIPAASGDTYYRTAIISGKTLSFGPWPTFTPAPATDFGTDGGVHNFLHFLENWGNVSYHYRGSMVSFYIGRQATGIFKCCHTVYSPPSGAGGRDASFDTEFLTISKLPPGTPRFTDVNALSYIQAILSNE